MGSRTIFATDFGRLLVVVAIALSLASLPGVMSREISLPGVHLVRANLAPNEAWYPAGPAMNSLQMIIFTDQASEMTSIDQAFRHPSQSSIDLTDTPIHSPNNYVSSPNYYEPAITPSGTFFEVEFNLANSFWGVNMDFGNNPNGTQIR